ncbi:amino acid ABC transporter substrate-binding protein [Caenimonas aquaedulcis]|nr:amino acid ABC transporter substrate-binding protein [Caenimonas aquaedulcis]
MFLCSSLAVAAEPVLARIAAGGKLVIAHRESSIPFSYVDADKRPVGYAMDLCLNLAEVIRKKTGAKKMEVEFLMVTSSTRIAAIAEGRADLECGATTNNAERREKVAFTIPHFITGARLLVRADSPATRIEDFEGKKIVSTKGTTPLKAVVQANKERLMNITILESADHAQGVEMVEKGAAGAFVMDDVLLYGLASNRPDPAALKIVGKYLTTEALAIMLPKNDPEFKKLVDDEMRRLILSREIYPIYDKWFMKPIPPHDKALNLPVNSLLKDFWKFPTDFVPF